MLEFGHGRSITRGLVFISPIYHFVVNKKIVTEPLWKLQEPADLAIAELGDHAIIYHSLSGETHQLNALAVETLKLIQEGQVTVPTILDGLCDIFDVEDKIQLGQQVKGLISQFENLGLIEPVIRED